jgi:cell division protein FtsB
MKKLLSLAGILFVALFANGQAYEGTIEFDKKKQEAILIDYNYSPEAVENGIIKKMEMLGSRGKEEKGVFNKDKGFRVYKDVVIPEISDQSMDYIVKVEPKSRKQKDAATLYLVIQKNGENAIRNFNTDDIRRAKSFVNDLVPHMEAANLELRIIEQEDVVAKSVKKLKNLKDDQKDMEDKIKKLEDDIRENIKNQEATEADIENQRKALEVLKARRTGT